MDNLRFKFRFWDKENQEMIKPNELLMYKGNTFNQDLGGMLLLDKRFIPIQCIGLKDKNGKLIYEGDIVKSDFDFITSALNPLLFKVGYVAFSEYVGGFAIKSQDNAAPYQQDRFGKIDAENCEVIGNIYENKELLEDKQ